MSKFFVRMYLYKDEFSCVGFWFESNFRKNGWKEVERIVMCNDGVILKRNETGKRE